MIFGIALAIFAIVPAAARAEDAPILRGSSSAEKAAGDELIVFKGTLLLNQFVYRAVLKLPPGAQADAQTARAVAEQLAAFLRDAGYDLAKVRAQAKDGRIEVQVDEGALDKIIVIGTGWITALRFRAALDLPLDVFNRRMFELQMPRLARQYGIRSYDFELWPVHLIDADNAVEMDELRAMPLLRPARGYELRIIAHGDPWSAGFSPEVLLNGSVGLGVGGRYRWRDLIQDGDRWQAHFRVGGATRSSLDPGGGTRLVNSTDYFSGRWLSRPLGGSSNGLRITVAPRLELWSLQRRDLMVENYRIGTSELGTGAGSQLTPGFAFYFTFGMQRRWLFDLTAARGSTLAPDAAKVPAVSNRAFLRLSSQYTSNPGELRQDLHNGISLELNAFRPTASIDRGYLRLDLQGRHIFSLGWHEIRVGAAIAGELGDVWYVDEVPLSDHLRIGFGIDKYTQRLGSLSLELRWSLLRDKVKVGVFNDLGVWRRLPRDDPGQSPELAGSTGGGLFLFLFDELQVDAYYGVGWSTDSSKNTGLALVFKEAF